MLFVCLIRVVYFGFFVSFSGNLFLLFLIFIRVFGNKKFKYLKYGGEGIRRRNSFCYKY